MKENEQDSDSSAKSSRRRRWDVKSRESFNSTLAFEVSSNETPKLENKLDKEKDISKKPNENSEIKSDSPVSSEIDNLSKMSGEKIQSEIVEFFYENQRNTSTATAPPLSPPTNSLNEKILVEDNKMNSNITQQLNKLNDDIVISKKFSNESSIPSVAVSGLILGPHPSSFNGNVSTIYCEKINNFVLSNDEKLNSQPNQQKEVNPDTQTSHAIFLQTKFRTFSVMCQGILAGVTLSHCIMAFILKSNFEEQNYNVLEQVFFALILFLTTICTVSAFDRCDLAGQGVFSGKGIQIPWIPLFYFISFTLSLVMIKAESFIVYFYTYSKNIQDKKEELIVWWQYMALSRTIFAVVAWAAQSTEPHVDALNDRITKLACSS